jgi:hypothetical protein
MLCSDTQQETNNKYFSKEDYANDDDDVSTIIFTCFQGLFSLMFFINEPLFCDVHQYVTGLCCDHCINLSCQSLTALSHITVRGNKVECFFSGTPPEGQRGGGRGGKDRPQ